MGADVNAVTLVGRLTKDPEVRGSGNVLAMRLAFSATRKDGDEWVDVPQYVDVVTFGRGVEGLSRLLGRGDQVAVNGRLAWREWDANDGSKRQAHAVVADRVQLLAKPRDKQGGSTPPPAPRDPVADAPPPPLPGMSPASADPDIPF
jgi:single-strand DNA-binding protein